jgi:hypothetical protein
MADDSRPADSVPLIHPWKTVPLDPAYSGAWVVTGDVDGDGRAEVVSARNVNEGDVHYTSAVAAQRLDGHVLWRWGNPHIGRRGLHHDVACQIYDWNGDGANEVIVCTQEALVELDGATGEERRKIPIPPGATDCLVFVNLSGGPRATDVLIKDRYSQIWALDGSGKLLWTVKNPGGFRTAHQPIPMDLDGDGRDEIMAGYAMLNPDGQTRWTLEQAGRFSKGHLDCCRILRKGGTPRDWRLAVATCTDNTLLVVDGAGRTLREVGGHHFESINIGRLLPGGKGAHMLVDLVDDNSIWVLDENGGLLGQFKTEYSRFHALVDWNGDGVDEIVVPHSRALFDARGNTIGRLALEPQADFYGGRPPEEGEIGNIVLIGDMTGDGIPDVTVTSPWSVSVFKNESGVKTGTRSLGCGPNFTLY